MPRVVGVLVGRPRGHHDAGGDHAERDRRPDPEVLAGGDGDQGGHGSLRRGDRGDDADLAEAEAGVDEQQPDDVARAGQRQPAERMAVQSGRSPSASANGPMTTSPVSITQASVELEPISRLERAAVSAVIAQESAAPEAPQDRNHAFRV